MNCMEFNRKTSESVILEKNKGVLKYLQYPSLCESGVCRHLFSTRLGGVSEGDIGTMTLSYSRGDKKENVDENFRRIADVLDVSVEQFVLSDQTHTNNVLLVGKKDCGKGILKPRDYTDVDGLVTNEAGVVLSTFYADCVPLFFVDPVKKAIGLSHSGWKGTVSKMGKVTVEKMTQCFGCDPKDVIACIGPSICVDCYEVSEDVYLEFERFFADAENISKIVVNKNEETKKAYLDLWQANLAVLLEAGLKKEHITLPDICTSCNKELLFSHRASHGKRGNLGAFLVLN